MTTCEQPTAIARQTLIVLAAALAAVVAGLIAIPIIAVNDLPVLVALLIPLGVLMAIAVLCNTAWGMYAFAFAIGPFGVVQTELASVTLNLPEVIIMALFLKEAAIFVIRRESLNPILPWRTLSLFLGMCLVAAAVGISNKNGTARVLQDARQFTEYIILYLLIVHRVSSKAHVMKTLFCYLAGTTLLAMHGILQHFTDFGIPLNQALSDAIFHSGTRGGSFYGATPLGGIMVLSVGVGIGLMLGQRSKMLKAAAAICTVICLVGAVYTYTRASWIAIAIVLTLTAALVKKSPKTIIATVLVGAAFFAVLGPTVAHRLSTLSFSRSERSLHERVNYYTAAWNIFRDHPVFGLGWGCHYRISDILINQGLEVPQPQLSAQKFRSTPPQEATVHSAYLQMLVKGGLAVLVTFLLFIFSWARTTYRATRLPNLTPFERNSIIALGAGLVAYMAHSAIENFFQWPVMAQSFWMLMGLTTALASVHYARKADHSEQASASPAP